MFLIKEKDPTTKLFDDDEWIRSLTEAQEITADIPQERVTCDQEGVDPQKFVPSIQMGEFLRKDVSRRRLALSEGQIAAFTTAMRLLGVGSQGGAKAHHLPPAHPRWMGVRMLGHPVGQNQSGRQELFWNFWTECSTWSSGSLPSQAQHYVEQEGLPSMPKHRGAEQGDVDGPLECFLALGMVAAETRLHIAACRAHAPFLGLRGRTAASSWTQQQDAAGRPGTCLAGERRLSGPLVQRWRHPLSPDLGTVQTARICAPVKNFERSETHRRQKSFIICRTWMRQPSVENRWCSLGSFCFRSGYWKQHTWSRCGTRQFIADQLLAKGDVQLCQEPQTEFALLLESLGVSRINHIFRVHDRTIIQEKRAAENFDEVGQRSLERLFQGFTEDSMEQATLSAGQSGIGYKRARDSVGPAHLGALIAAKPRILEMIQDAATAGLLPKQPTVTRLDAVIEAATAAYLAALDGVENVTALPYIRKAAQAADEAWQQTVQRHNGPRTQQYQRLSGAALPHRMMMMNQDPLLLHPGRADSVQRSSQRSSRGCLSELDWGAWRIHKRLIRSSPPPPPPHTHNNTPQQQQQQQHKITQHHTTHTQHNNTQQR